MRLRRLESVAAGPRHASTTSTRNADESLSSERTTSASRSGQGTGAGPGVRSVDPQAATPSKNELKTTVVSARAAVLVHQLGAEGGLCPRGFSPWEKRAAGQEATPAELIAVREQPAGEPAPPWSYPETGRYRLLLG